MAISRREALKHGISYGTGALNHGNDSIVYDRALRKFPKDETFTQLKSTIDAGDATAAAPQPHRWRKHSSTYTRNWHSARCTLTCSRSWKPSTPRNFPLQKNSKQSKPTIAI